MLDPAEHAAGVLLGLAAGDQIGGPIRMALKLAESLSKQQAFDKGDIERRYLAWWRGDAFDMGPTVAAVFKLVDAGVSWEVASMQVHRNAGGMTAGCNPAHRCAPLAAAGWLGDSILDACTREEACLTHQHPLAGEGAVAVVRVCRRLILGVPWSEALSQAAEGLGGETQEALLRSHRPLSRGGFAPEVLRAAVHFIDQADSLPEALSGAYGFAGIANYCPVLVGSIGGARWGRGQVDESMLHHQGELLPHLQKVANQLALGWHPAGIDGLGSGT